MADPAAGPARGAVDPRLLRSSRGVRLVLVGGVVVAAATAVLVVVQAFALADAITGAFQHGADLTVLRPTITLLALVVLGRAGLAGTAEVLAQRAASRTSAELRATLLAHVARLGPGWLAGERRAHVATLATRGIDAVEPYVARYLPQLVIAAVVPLIVGVAILTQDVLAAVVVALTVPLIPLFMVLVGLYTRHATDRQWRSLSLLSHHFLDVVVGLPTLKAFGRARAQARTLREIDARYRRATMGVLRISFLSSLVLELLATLSVAVVAVSIGLRLLDGDMDLRTGLVVLILAPEVYLPIRMVGTQFHAAADGVSAAAEVFDVLETPVRVSGTRSDAPAGPVVLTQVSVSYDGRAEPALPPTSLTLRPGRITALVGPSGCGKTTLLSVLLGFVAPTSGVVEVGGTPLGELDPDAWRAQLAWVGQDPVLLGPTVADDVRMGRPGAGDGEVGRALLAAGLGPSDLPAGLSTPVGDLASAVSTGQRRRVVLARAVLRRARVVLLDEPTAALDEAAERAVAGTVRSLADDGACVLVVAHRPAFVELADEVVVIAPSPAAIR